MKQKRRQQRLELKAIEKILHPTPTINGVEINHYHQGQYIYFSAWKGQDKVNQKETRWHRQRFLHMRPETNFYQLFNMDFEWLSNLE